MWSFSSHTNVFIQARLPLFTHRKYEIWNTQATLSVTAAWRKSMMILPFHDAPTTLLTSQPFLHEEHLLELVGRPCERVPEQAGTYLSDMSVITGWDSTRPMKGKISKTTDEHEIY